MAVIPREASFTLVAGGLMHYGRRHFVVGPKNLVIESTLPVWDSGRESNEPMEIHVETTDGDAVIKLTGKLDMNTSPDLRKAALKLCSRGKYKNLTINLSGVSYVDTSGLATLVELFLVAKEMSAQLSVSGANETVRYLIEVNGLAGFFRLEALTRENLHA